MPRYGNKKDLTHNGRVAEMRAYGLDVVDTTQAGGDLLDCHVQHIGTGRAKWVEIKNDKHGKPTDKAAKFIAEHPESCAIVRDYDDVLALVNILSR